MAGRRTNLALFVLLAGALVTGALAYGIGSGWARWAVVAHGVAGLGIVLLAPWKSAIARRGVERRRPGTGTSIALAVLVVVTVLTGLLHATGLGVSLGNVTSMQLHVAAALVSVPLAIWHVVARRVRPRRTDLTRRNLLRAGGVAAGAAAVYAATEGLVRVTGLPGEDRRFTGSYEAGTFDPERMPVTQWLNDRVPAVDGDAWRLTVVTPGGTETLALADLRGDDRVRATIDCTGGWFAEQDWEGLWLAGLIGDASGRSVRVGSVTGYSRRFPLRDAGGLLLATRVGGAPLAAGHGFPARLVAPGRRGFWWVKWVTSIEVDDTPSWWQPPFPLT